MNKLSQTALAAAATMLLPAVATAQVEYAKFSAGTRILEAESGLTIKVLVEASTLGSAELEVAEIFFPYGPAPGRGHRHQSTEIFYIIEGELEHIVNGESIVLSPGMVGIVRAGDEVIHKVNSEIGVEALVIWVPGGEVDRIAGFLSERPIEN